MTPLASAIKRSHLLRHWGLASKRGRDLASLSAEYDLRISSNDKIEPPESPTATGAGTLQSIS